MGLHLHGKTTDFPLAEVVMILNICDLPPYKNRFFLHQKYVVEKLTCEEIAKEIFSARTTVLKYLKLFNIPVREVGNNQKRKRGLAYGKKIRNRHMEDYTREQENIKKMKELRDKGFSYHKIADVFNALKVPTKTRSGKWHSKTIFNILNE